MTPHNVVLGTVYLLQIIIGVLGNFFLIYHYSVHFITHNRPRHINLTLLQLSFANAMFLLCRGLPIIMFSWGVKYFLNDVVCKITIYLQRVFRDVSLCSTCLLSSLQAIVISPNSSKWAIFKVKSQKGIIPCCIFSWIFNLFMDTILLEYIIGPTQNSTKNKELNKLGYCTLDPYAIYSLKLQLWKSLCDFVLVVFLVITSGYMVFLLYQHHQQVQHIHGTSLSSRVSPEIKATKAIVLLVSTFFLFNLVSSIISIYTNQPNVTGPWLFYVPMFLSMCFQALSPFLLLSSETWVPWEFCCFVQKIKDSCATSIPCQTHTEP